MQGGGGEESYFGTYSRAVLSFVSNEGKRKKWKEKKKKNGLMGGGGWRVVEGGFKV